MIKECKVTDEDDDDRAMQRPMKRLKRLSSPRHAELAADLEDDLQDESIDDDGEEDLGERPPTVCSLCPAAGHPRQ